MSIPTVAIAGVPDPLPEGLTVLDVREDDEWAYGHIEGSLHIPMMEIPTRLDELPEDRRRWWSARWVRGRRRWRRTSCSNGYDAVNLDGGLVDWDAAGRPMVSDTAQPADRDLS